MRGFGNKTSYHYIGQDNIDTSHGVIHWITRRKLSIQSQSSCFTSCLAYWDKSLALPLLWVTNSHRDDSLWLDAPLANNLATDDLR